MDKQAFLDGYLGKEAGIGTAVGKLLGKATKATKDIGKKSLNILGKPSSLISKQMDKLLPRAQAKKTTTFKKNPLKSMAKYVTGTPMDKNIRPARAAIRGLLTGPRVLPYKLDLPVKAAVNAGAGYGTYKYIDKQRENFKKQNTKQEALAAQYREKGMHGAADLAMAMSPSSLWQTGKNVSGKGDLGLGWNLYRSEVLGMDTDDSPQLKILKKYLGKDSIFKPSTKSNDSAVKRAWVQDVSEPSKPMVRRWQQDLDIPAVEKASPYLMGSPVTAFLGNKAREAQGRAELMAQTLSDPKTVKSLLSHIPTEDLAVLQQHPAGKKLFDTISRAGADSLTNNPKAQAALLSQGDLSGKLDTALRKGFPDLSNLGEKGKQQLDILRHRVTALGGPLNTFNRYHERPEMKWRTPEWLKELKGEGNYEELTSAADRELQQRGISSNIQEGTTDALNTLRSQDPEKIKDNIVNITRGLDSQPGKRGMQTPNKQTIQQTISKLAPELLKLTDDALVKALQSPELTMAIGKHLQPLMASMSFKDQLRFMSAWGKAKKLAGKYKQFKGEQQ